MVDIFIDNILASAAPSLRVIAISADVVNPTTIDNLWTEIEALVQSLRERFANDILAINKLPAISATRAAYKALGKEPNRYRPSAEALCRRAAKGISLYRSLSVIDIINYVSMMSGYSIGGFDADKIEGNTLTLGVGMAGEPYEAIGRGQLNIACLPVYRDSVGGIGTPTSDHERTKLSPATRHLLMIVNAYDGDDDNIRNTVSKTEEMLVRFASATNIVIKEYKI